MFARDWVFSVPAVFVIAYPQVDAAVEPTIERNERALS
jgi:hypothetical protein